MNRFASSPAYLNGLPPTGQTTVYVTGDNGTNQTGLPHRYEARTDGQYSGTTAIILNGKTDNHSNAVVIDHQFGLMWLRTNIASVGPTSNGLLPWTTNANGEGIFSYAAAANAAGLSGHTDWRVPNANELGSLCNYATGIDATAFPVWDKVNSYWTSTTRAASSLQAFFVSFGLPAITTGTAKTVTLQTTLCRRS